MRMGCIMNEEYSALYCFLGGYTVLERFFANDRCHDNGTNSF